MGNKVSGYKEIEVMAKSKMETKTNEKKTTDSTIVAWIGALFLCGLFLGGLGTIVWQIYNYFRNGEWVHISIITILQRMNYDWAFYPTDWIGLHNFLDEIPASLAGIGVGVALLYYNMRD